MATNTEVDICNIALSNIRAKSINSLSESSIESQNCKLKYYLARDKVLSDSHWRFAKKIIPLALRTDTLHEWSLCYAYPSDCLSLRDVIPQNIITSNNRARLSLYNTTDTRLDNLFLGNDYEVLSSGGDKVIGTDIIDAYAVYTYEASNTALYTPNFIGALSWYLASQLAIPILGEGKGRTFMSDALTMYSRLLADALSNNDGEAHSTHRPDSEFIRARS